MRTDMDDSQERKLSEVLSEFARTMATDFPIQAILDHLITRTVEMLPITAASVGTSMQTFNRLMIFQNWI